MSRSCLLLLVALSVLAGCQAKQERQPTAAEVRQFTRELDRAEAAAVANSIEASRAKEQSVEQKHAERLRARD